MCAPRFVVLPGSGGGVAVGWYPVGMWLLVGLGVLFVSFLHALLLWLVLGYHHTMISLICMSNHKALTTRCLSNRQAAYRQPAIRAMPQPLRRLALSKLFTIMTNSFQTTSTVSERSSIKGNMPMYTRT